MTDLLEVAENEQISRRLDYIYSQVPMNDCQRCADCCFNSPQVHPIEFLNICRHLRTLPELTQATLGRKLVEYELLNLATLKNKCPFLGNEGCLVYSSRPLQCRLFGLYPKDEYERIVEDCRSQNNDLADYYGKVRKLPLPKSVMTYDVDQCENNVRDDGSILVIAACERNRINQQIADIGSSLVPAHQNGAGLISFSHQYTRLYFDDDRLEKTKIKAVKEFLSRGAAPTLNQLLDSRAWLF